MQNRATATATKAPVLCAAGEDCARMRAFLSADAVGTPSGGRAAVRPYGRTCAVLPLWDGRPRDAVRPRRPRVRPGGVSRALQMAAVAGRVLGHRIPVRAGRLRTGPPKVK
ncbi:hypothetical protein GCM10010343_73730 [Streptomyces avidinii]|nr:hypothetical protein GCM10010343_73730 [Streptomyces avidinii]